MIDPGKSVIDSPLLRLARLVFIMYSRQNKRIGPLEKLSVAYWREWLPFSDDHF